jgi:hypothetical protein
LPGRATTSGFVCPPPRPLPRPLNKIGSLSTIILIKEFK